MKKANLILAIAAGTLLASCASSLTREQAAEQLDKCSKKVESKDFALPNKVTMKNITRMSDEEEGNLDLTTEISLDLEKHYFKSYEEDEEGKAYQWIFEKDGKYYGIYSESDKDFSDAEIYLADSEEFEFNVGMYFNKELLAESYRQTSESLADFSKQATESSQTSVKADKNNLTEKYSSSGDGNLTIEFKYEFAASLKDEILGSQVSTDISLLLEMSVSIDNYLPKSMKMNNEDSTTIAGKTVSSKMSSEETYDWGTCKIDIPNVDLSKAEID